MPLTNGDNVITAPPLANGPAIDHTEALAVLEKEYAQSDGLDAKTLLDSRLRGGLTYNDFLVLPGYIGECHDFFCAPQLTKI